MPKLLLFDIDGTLVHSGGAGRRAIKQTFLQLYGDARPIDAMDFAGRTDSWIFTTALGQLGLEVTLESPDYRQATRTYLDLLRDSITTAELKRVYPGVKSLVRALHRTDDCYLGLLTGNFEAGARIKLDPFELNDYFPTGGFSDHHVERAEVAAHAVERASAHFGIDFQPDEIYVIGDTERDIACGRDNDFRTIAVATGTRSVETLRDHEPDHLFESFENYEDVVRIVDGNGNGNGNGVG